MLLVADRDQVQPRRVKIKGPEEAKQQIFTYI